MKDTFFNSLLLPFVIGIMGVATGHHSCTREAAAAVAQAVVVAAAVAYAASASASNLNLTFMFEFLFTSGSRRL